MIAASALVVAVLASYAGIGMLSMNATTPFSAFSKLPGVNAVVSGIGWNPPSVKSITAYPRKAASAAASAGVLSDTGVFNLGQVAESSAPVALPLKNTSSSAVTYRVSVNGPGLSASFDNHLRQRTVQPKRSAVVYVSSSPLYAGPINGQLVLSASGFGSQTIPLQGIQAPVAPGAVTATPAKGGAVNLSWAPSGSISGVRGYIVQRSTGGAPWTSVTGVEQGTSAVDRTPSDGTYSYQVVAVSEGSPGADSGPSPSATATSDSTAPNPPASVSGPGWINSSNQSDVRLTVTPGPGSQPGDTVTVTLTGPAGGAASSQPTPVGSGGPVTVDVNAQSLSDGKVTVSASASDSLGNTSTMPAIDETQIPKDTLPPGDPAPPTGLQTITEQNAKSYTFPVEVGTPTAATDTIHAVFTDANGVTATGSGSAADGVVHMQDLTQLADGKSIQVSVWITDAAGNASNKVSGTVAKQATPPPAPTVFQIAAGPNNPVNVVTPQSASAVYITATFAQAPPAGVEIKVFGDNRTLVDQQGDGQTTTYTFGPFDFSDMQPGGPYKIGMNQIDSVGNDTWSQFMFTVDGGAAAPTSVGVPAGPSNPAGYVNAATQTAATIVATFAAPTDPADQIALSVDGLSLGAQSGGSDTISWTGDLSSLPDGTLGIQGTITDPNGVTSTFSGSLIKDTTPPPAPAVAGVVGPPPNVITAEDASCVKVAVAFNQAPESSDTVTVTLSDGSNSVQGSAPAGGGEVTIGCMDASSLADGPISVTVTVTDVAGNSVTFTGTPATKVACHQSQSQSQSQD